MDLLTSIHAIDFDQFISNIMNMYHSFIYLSSKYVLFSFVSGIVFDVADIIKKENPSNFLLNGFVNI